MALVMDQVREDKQCRVTHKKNVFKEILAMTIVNFSKGWITHRKSKKADAFLPIVGKNVSYAVIQCNIEGISLFCSINHCLACVSHSGNTSVSKFA